MATAATRTVIASGDVERPAAGGRWATHGQPVALAAIAGMVRGPSPHAVLLVGPAGVGKTTLADDLAAGLLCVAPDVASRPCGSCRGCRLIAGGNHPDLHRVVPEGPGGQVVIGDARDGRATRGIRDLLRELAYLPVEGGARVAIVEGASQMNDDAQNALLKTLEEPPPGVVIVLCVDEEEALLPTVRSRCTRVRLGPVGPRAIEDLLGARSLADAATAGRLARIADGRPGVAVAYARAPEAVTIREEIGRTLLDLLGAPPAGRLAAAHDLTERAREHSQALAGPAPEASVARRSRSRSAGRGAVGGPSPSLDDPTPTGAPASPPLSGEGDGVAVGEGPADQGDGAAQKVSAADRRLAARTLLAIWRDLARDLAVAGAGGRREVRDVGLMEELQAASARLAPGAASGFLARLDRTSELLAGNVSPELAIDVLLLAWPDARSPVR